MLNPAAFDTVIDGKKVHLFTLKNNYLTVDLTNYGARVVRLIVPDKNGKLTDVSIGFDSIQSYTEGGETYFGSVVGRYANRISNGTFMLEGKTHTLSKNIGTDHLHGGHKSFSSVVWDAFQEDDTTIAMHYFSKDGEEGYPGNMHIKVVYSLVENALQIHVEATTDATTIINVTNHTFFNLNGEGSGNIEGHLLQIAAKKFTPMNASMIPNGELKNVEGTVFDFQTTRTIGAHINDTEDEQIKTGRGYDHNFVLDKKENAFEKVAEAVGDLSGIVMEVFTTEPGMQLYTGNFMDGSHILKCGARDEFRTAFCLETQHFPDSPNRPAFPTTALKPGEVFRSKTAFVFGVKK